MNARRPSREHVDRAIRILVSAAANARAGAEHHTPFDPDPRSRDAEFADEHMRLAFRVGAMQQSIRNALIALGADDEELAKAVP